MNSSIRINPAIIALAAACGLSAPDAALAQSHALEKTGEQLVSVSVKADTDHVVAGETFNLVFLFKIDPHWHIYWESPGATGMPTSIDVTAPAGFEVGPTLFTRPQRFGSADSIDGVNYGYEGHAALVVPVTAPSDLAPNAELTFTTDVMWLVCKQVCLMGQASPSITLSSGAASGGEVDEAVRRAKARLPHPLDEVEGATIKFDGSHLTVSLPARDFAEAMLFPLEKPGVTYGDPEVKVADGVVTATVDIDIEPQNALGEAPMIAGVIGLGANPDDPCYSFEIPSPGS